MECGVSEMKSREEVTSDGLIIAALLLAGLIFFVAGTFA